MSSKRSWIRSSAVPLTFIALSAVIHFLLGAFHPNIHTRAERVRASPLPVTVYSLARPSPLPTLKHTPRPSPSITFREPHRTQTRSTKIRRLTVSASPRFRKPRLPAASNIGVNASTASAPQARAASTALPEAAPTETPVPTPAAAPTPLDARDIIVAAQFVHRAPLRYPPIAKDAGWQGTVMILLTIGPDGIERTSIGSSSGYPALDRAALAAAKESTYRSPEVNGKPAIETYRIIYTFSLDS
ncbi:MAG: TonB family protein [Candidatus Eremiobacter antarcticus]|nr:TonB family protein [Candidatus Eremiobacteraeota bacterium]MBC5807426.1 TonB family protein [Candidatus Eremiobacteraeota bacterium]